MADLQERYSRAALALSRLPLDQLVQLVGMTPIEQQADVWQSAAEAFENDENHPERWGRAVFCYQKVLELSSDEQNKPVLLSRLSTALLNRANSSASPERDIQLAVDTAKEAMELARDDPYLKLFKGNYGEARFRMYQLSGAMGDFEAGRDAIREAIHLADKEQDSHMLELWYGKLRQELSALAIASGVPENINEALVLFGIGTPDFQEDVDLMYYYAVLLQQRHLLSRSTPDIILSIKTVRCLLEINSEQDNYGVLLSLQADNLRILARRNKDVKHCDDAIDLLDKALSWLEERRKLNKQDRAALLGSKAATLRRRYDLSGEDHKSKATVPNADLDEAIDLSRQAVQESENGNLLGTLGANLLCRYRTKTPSQADLTDAISSFRKALELQTKVFHAQSFACLGSCLRAQAEETNSDASWDLAAQAYENGAACVESPPYDRICAADDGANCIFSRDPARAFRLFETAIELLPLLSPASLTLVDQEHNLAHFDNIAWSAAAACLEVTGDVYRAIRLSEIGRSIIANFRLNLKHDLSALEQHHSRLAEEFRLAQSALSSNIASLETSLHNASTKSRDAQLQTTKVNSILARIRSKPGFESFLDCPSESELLGLAESGPLVVFSVTSFRSDALLISKDALKSLRLPKLTMSDVLKYGEQFIEAVATRSVKKYAEARKQMKSVLAWLWDVAVCPVLEELGYTTMPEADGEWQRIWWVRSGVFSLLPLHAAGHHDVEPRVSAMDRVISSYTPTIKSLQHSRREAASVLSEDQKILVLGMPVTPGQDDLPDVVNEISELENMFPSPPATTTKLNPSCDEALQLLADADIFHFSGHGVSSTVDPLLSCLLMQDWKTKPLTISRLLHLDSVKGQFAYLSACHTGGSPNTGFVLADESLHISSAFQLAGFRTVVATLWYCHSNHSKTIANQLYKHMLNKSRILSPQKSAEGLHHAVRTLRDELRKMSGTRKQKPDDPLVWAAYIHTGA